MRAATLSIVLVLLAALDGCYNQTAAAAAAGWTSDAETLRTRLSAQMGALPDWGPVVKMGYLDTRSIDTAPSGKGALAYVDSSGRVTQFVLGDVNLSSLTDNASAVVEAAIPAAAAADKSGLKARLIALVQAGHPGHTDLVTVDGVTFSASHPGSYQLGAQASG